MLQNTEAQIIFKNNKGEEVMIDRGANKEEMYQQDEEHQPKSPTKPSKA
jgi:hypothetical protein